MRCAPRSSPGPVLSTSMATAAVAPCCSRRCGSQVPASCAHSRDIALAGPGGRHRCRTRRNLRLQTRIGAGMRRLPVANSSDVGAHHREPSPQERVTALGEPATRDPDARTNDTPVSHVRISSMLGRVREGAGGWWGHCVEPTVSTRPCPARFTGARAGSSRAWAGRRKRPGNASASTVAHRSAPLSQ